MKIIEIITHSDYKTSIEDIAEHFNADIWFGPVNDDERISARLLVQPEERQAVLDGLQGMVQSANNTRILILPVETALPKEDEETITEEKQKKSSSSITREEIFSRVEKDAQLNSNFFYW